MPRLSRLANGVTIATEAHARVGSAAVALCVRGGVRAQRAAEGGFAHLLEHLLFDGPNETAARARAHEFEAMGGGINAYTGREHIAWSGVVPAVHAAQLVASLAQLVVHAQFSDAMLGAELNALAHERAAESAADQIEQAVLETIWPGHRLAQPILGAGDLGYASAATLNEFSQRLLRAPRVHVLATGALHRAEIETAAQALSALPAHDDLDWGAAPQFASGARRAFQSVGAAQVVWALPVPGLNDAAPDTAALLQHLLLGSSHARVCRLVHEELNAGYALHGRLLQYSDAGVLYFGLHFHRASGLGGTAIAAVENLLDALAARGFSVQEFARAEQALAARRIVEADRLDERLEWLAQHMHFHASVTRATNLAELNECMRQACVQRALLRWEGRAD